MAAVPLGAAQWAMSRGLALLGRRRPAAVAKPRRHRAASIRFYSSDQPSARTDA
jgi:hypothetical protein